MHSSKYGSFIRSCTNRTRTISFTRRSHVAKSTVTTWSSFSRVVVRRTSRTASTKGASHRRSRWRPSTHEQNPWWCHGLYDMWCTTYSQSQWRTCSVHLQRPGWYTSTWNAHGVQPSLLHQPAHLVHVGSLPPSVHNGHSLARSNWRYICSPQWGPPDRTSQWISSSLDWRPRIWHFISKQYPIFSRLTISHTSCVWAAMRLFQTATCFHNAAGKKPLLSLVLSPPFVPSQFIAYVIIFFFPPQVSISNSWL